MQYNKVMIYKLYPTDGGPFREIITDTPAAYIRELPGKSVWLNIETDDRSAAAGLLEGLLHDPGSLFIQNPEDAELWEIHEGFMVVNLVLPKPGFIYEAAYLTIMLRPPLVISIWPEQVDLAQNLAALKEEILSKQSFTFDTAVLLVVSQLTKTSTLGITAVRKRLMSIAEQIDKSPDSLSSAALMKAKREISQFNNIIEDQYFTLQLMPKLNWEKRDVEARRIFEKLLKDFQYLQRITERLEGKMENLYGQYQLALQDKTNHRLTILTILQAIFVPLTLIVGLYGMNFSYMPVLEWKFGYFFILGVMALITAVELWFFRRNGWFD